MKSFYTFISAPNGLTAIFVREGASDTLFHVLSDHLGSVSGVINAKSNEVKYYSYSAWGVPRDADDWTADFSGELFAGRGYTGHEHLQEFDLINMNGRVYDPVLARFLSPDSLVQVPGSANSYNRYAYVWNNPLIFSDPSGYKVDRPLKNEFTANWDGHGGGSGYDPLCPTGWGVFPRMGTLGLSDQQSYDYMFAMNVGISTGDYSLLNWYGDDVASGKYGAAMDWNNINKIANSFLSSDYSYGGSDLLRINPSNGFFQEYRTAFAELNDAIIDNYNMAFLEGYGNLGYGLGGDGEIYPPSMLPKPYFMIGQQAWVDSPITFYDKDGEKLNGILPNTHISFQCFPDNLLGQDNELLNQYYRETSSGERFMLGIRDELNYFLIPHYPRREYKKSFMQNEDRFYLSIEWSGYSGTYYYSIPRSFTDKNGNPCEIKF